MSISFKIVFIKICLQYLSDILLILTSCIHLYIPPINYAFYIRRLLMLESTKKNLMYSRILRIYFNASESGIMYRIYSNTKSSRLDIFTVPKRRCLEVLFGSLNCIKFLKAHRCHSSRAVVNPQTLCFLLVPLK